MKRNGRLSSRRLVLNTQVHKQHRPSHFRACTASLPLEISLTLSLGAVQSCIGLQVHGLALRTSTSVRVCMMWAPYSMTGYGYSMYLCTALTVQRRAKQNTGLRSCCLDTVSLHLTELRLLTTSLSHQSMPDRDMPRQGLCLHTPTSESVV